MTEINASVMFLVVLYGSSEYTKTMVSRDGFMNHPRFERRTFRTLSGRRMQRDVMSIHEEKDLKSGTSTRISLDDLWN